MDKTQILNNIENLEAEELFEYICQCVVTIEELKNSGNLVASKRKAIQNMLASQKQDEDDGTANKAQIIANTENLSAEQLFDYIRQDVVTLAELKSSGNLDASKRKTILGLQTARDREDDEAWERCRYNESELSNYVAQYPAGKHIAEAKDRIEFLEQQRREAQANRQDILTKISLNANSFTPGMISSFLSEGTVTKDDLINCGIPGEIVDRMENIVSPALSLGEIPRSIPDGYTEVYFWGIPGSGKTCALAAILNTAERKGYLEIAVGPGYDYMTRLKNIFITQYGVLPSASPVETTQYLPFVLKRGKDKPRSISLIELSGEIFQCFYNKSAGLPFSTQSHENTFNNLMNFLKSKNRKIHFFFIDYEKENNVDINNHTQSDYLQAAATFFKNNDVFSKATDAIYIVITKSDLMPAKNMTERVAFSKQYLQNNNFTAFLNSLKERCKQHSINGGKLTVEPFSLGKVYFQQICSIDREDSERIINILVDRIVPNKKSILDVFNK
ncbi:MAG: hypothetical protein LBQ01_07445 [Prevotellaceae bacterium]|jgi:hypothetical protein|nr:hypothetical protein [Prevotellaceae bacterium]